MRSLRDSLGRPILWITVVLAIIGVVEVFSASAVMTASTGAFNHDPLFFFKRQFVFTLVGLVGMAAVRRLDLLRWRPVLSLPTMAVTLLMLVAVMLVGTEINGARRWFILGPIQIQVAEFAKLAVIFYLADCLARHRERARSLWAVWPVLLLVLTAIILIEQEPDLGTALVVSATLVAMLYAAGTRVRDLAFLGVSGATAITLMIAAKPYRIERLKVFVDPFAEPLGAGYQLCNSLMAVASGGIWGRGIPFSHQKYNYLPEQHTDFIFAILSEEIGFVGSVGLLALFTLLCYCGFRLAVNCRRPYLSLLALGVTFQVVFQAVMNIGVVTSSIPSTGIPLPFLSYGGSSMVVTLLSMGILLNIADHTGRQTLAAPLERGQQRRMRRGSTLATSEQEAARSVSTGEWEAVVAPARQDRPRTNLPQPVVEPHLTRRVPFHPASRTERERLRRHQKRVQTLDF